MAELEFEPSPSLPSPFQFSLRTLLLLCVVLASSLAVFGLWGIAVFAVAMTVAVNLRYGKPLPTLLYAIVIGLVSMCLLSGLLLSAVESGSMHGRRGMCINNLKQISLALEAYHQANGCFPPAYVADKNGKPMHSWRMLILPYLGCDALYKTYDFSEPWNGPRNKKLQAIALPVFQCPGVSYRPGNTNYLAVVGPNCAWLGDKPRKAADFGQDGRDTIVLIEAASSDVAWSEPRDITLEALTADSKLLPSSRHGPSGNFLFLHEPAFCAEAITASGNHVAIRPSSLSAENLRKILQVGGIREELAAGSGDDYDHDWQLNWPNIAALAVWLLSSGALLVGAVRARKKATSRPANESVTN